MTRRISLHSLPEVIPVFPLEGALLLPRARLPLNIFEPRYLAMLDDVLRSDHRLIGMAQPRQDGPNPPLYEIGCCGRITSFSETEDGRYLIALSGVIRFRIAEEIEGFTPFRRIKADWSNYTHDMDPPPSEINEDDRKVFLSLLRRYFDAAKLSADWEALSRADDETLVNAIAMLCPFSPQEKQALMEAPTLEDRKRDLKALMQFVVAAPEGSADLQ
ncbi:MAG: LON peptidase substrate-binding domain-containing protein [Rhodobacteraceae bacterium]|nr:LON peptidase substrate-binding domain-containing protein [Paracoccaceae bacterium]